MFYLKVEIYVITKYEENVGLISLEKIHHPSSIVQLFQGER